MNIAQVMILPVVAVAALSIFCKTLNVFPKESTSRVAPSVVVAPAPYVAPVNNQTYPISNSVLSSTELINAGIASIGREEHEPRKMHFELTITLPAKE